MANSSRTTTSEKKVPNGYFSVVFGTSNKANPYAVYVEIKGYVTPEFSSVDYSGTVKTAEKRIKMAVRRFAEENGSLDGRYIFDMHIPVGGMEYGKGSFVKIQCIFRQKDRDCVVPFSDLYASEYIGVSNMADGIASILSGLNMSSKPTKN